MSTEQLDWAQEAQSPSSRTERVVPVEELDGQAVDAVNRTLRLLPWSEPDRSPLRVACEALEGLLGDPHDLFFHKCGVHWESSLPDEFGAAIAFEFHLPPDPDTGVLVLDANLAEHWLEVLLDDEPPSVRRLAPFTPRDHGLVIFVLLHVLDAWTEYGFPPVVLSSQQPDPRAPLEGLSESGRVVEAVFGITTNRSAGLARLFVPHGLVRNLEMFDDRTTVWKRRIDRLVQRAGHAHTRLAASLGRVWLANHEVSQLAEGDVLVPEDHGVELPEISTDSDDGFAAVMPGSEPREIEWCCRVRPSENSRWSFEFDERGIREIVCPEPGEEMSDPDKTEMLESADVRVDFRVGEVSLPLRELSDLEPGYVLETEREVGDGIDICVEGRTVARGELVSIDGRLGIRVTSKT